LSALRRWVRAERGGGGSDGGQKTALGLADRQELARLRNENERLRVEREILRKAVALLCERTRVRYGFIREQKEAYPVTVLFAVMQVSASACHAWAKQPEVTGQAKESQAFDQWVSQIFEADRG